jgi:(p)ppGpp synthase/HD superfamily hydrolase
MNDIVLVMRAAEFAAHRHAGQRRKGKAGEPYVNHLAEVAGLLAEATDGSDTELIAAGWLHDTIEDTETSKGEIEASFGARIAGLVLQVTDDKTLPQAERKRLQVAAAPHKSAAAKTLKIADKTSNLRALIA